MSLPIAQLKLQNSPVVQGNRYEKLGMGVMLSMVADETEIPLLFLKVSVCPRRNYEMVLNSLAVVKVG